MAVEVVAVCVWGVVCGLCGCVLFKVACNILA